MTYSGLLEVVVWQYYNINFSTVDPTLRKMTRPSRSCCEPVSRGLTLPKPFTIQLALSFSINSSLGVAVLSAQDRTYSDFVAVPRLFLGNQYQHGSIEGLTHLGYNASVCGSES